MNGDARLFDEKDDDFDANGRCGSAAGVGEGEDEDVVEDVVGWRRKEMHMNR